MANVPALSILLDVPMPVEAVLDGTKLRVGELLALRAGSVIATGLPAGGNVTVLAGHTRIGLGELAAANGRLLVRMLNFGGDD
jgi:flagellar motor switch/type III secretory pathway protein FliN